MKHTTVDDLEHFYNEVSIQNIMAANGLAPSILQIIEGTNRDCAIIMTPLYKTLGDAIENAMANHKRTPEAIAGDFMVLINKAIELLYTMHSLGYAHRDTHRNNFMLDNDGKMYIIDFNKSGQITKASEKLEDIRNLIDDTISEIRSRGARILVEAALTEKFGVDIL